MNAIARRRSRPAPSPWRGRAGRAGPGLALALLLAALLTSAACGLRANRDPDDPPAGGSHPAQVVPPGGGAADPAADPDPAGEDDREGLRLRLSETGEPESERGERPVAVAERLSAADVERLLQRLPPLTAVQGDVREFHFRPESRPPPITGATVEQRFPPAAEGGAAVSPPMPPPVLPLTVTRRAPEGPLDLASHLAVTFSQPMVALTSVDDAGTRLPVQLDPQPAGQWRWLDTATLLFEPDGGRFPMATRYEVVVPFGTEAKGGGALDEHVAWSFTTPAPRLQWAWPSGDAVTETPVVVAVFDQRIDPAAVLRHTRLRAGGGTRELQLVGRDALLADPWTRSQGGDGLRRRLDDVPDGHWLAFRAHEPLPLDASVTVSFDRGLPSAEGPRTTEAVQTHAFEVHGALELAGHWCGAAHLDECRPGWGWTLEFTNALDAAAFDPELVTVVPAVDELQAWVSGRHLNLTGRTAANTDYQVFVDGGLRDVFGQSLGETAVVDFEVGEPRRPWPQLFLPDGSFHVLEPDSDGSLRVHSVNYEVLELAVYAVDASQWGSYADAPEFWQAVNDGSSPQPPGRQVFAARHDLSDRPDELVATRIDLSPALGEDGRGHAIVRITAREPDPRPDHWRPRTEYRWVQRGTLAVDAALDATRMLAWVTDLADGTPREGVEVTLHPDGLAAVSDADGLARLDLPEGRSAPRWLVAGGLEGGALLPEHTWSWGWRRERHSGWVARDRSPQVLWHVQDDRGMYRPGEDVHVVGWVREHAEGVGGDVAGFPRLDRPVSWTAADSQGNELHAGEAALDAFGAFTLDFTLPATVNLGVVSLRLELPDPEGRWSGEAAWHQVQVQEFRRPEYEVSVSADAGPHFVGGAATASVLAEYYAGGGLADTEVEWSATATAGHFVPPGRDGFTFGDSAPWWWWGGWDQPDPVTETLTGRTDDTGAHHLLVEFLSARPPRPWQVRVEAGVTDVNRQRWAGSASLLVHPSEVYVGLRSERGFVQAGQPVDIELVAVDLDGAAVPGRRLELRAWREGWARVDGGWRTVERDVQERELVSGAEPVSTRFEGLEGGRWTIRAETTDAAGRRNRSTYTVWVSGGERPPSRDVSEERLTLIPDKQEYQPGDMAEILVQAPFVPAHGLLRLERSGLVEARAVEFDDRGSATLRIPITEAHIRNLYVSVVATGSTLRTDDDGTPLPDAAPRPAFAGGQVQLDVPPRRRELTVTVTPRHAELEPGGETHVDVSVTDADGEPLGEGAVALIVADEAVLALSGFQLKDPLESFYRHRGQDVRWHALRPFLLLGEPAPHELPEDAPEESRGSEGFLYKLFGGARADSAPASAPMAERARRAGEADFAAGEALGLLQELGYTSGDDGRVYEPGGGEGETPVRERSNLDPLALFVGSAELGPDGTAAVPMTLPDNLTRYRIMVVAVDRGQRFGKGENTVTARLPLMARPSPPRFLNYGDVFELPVVLQNGTDAELVVELAARASNASFTEGAGRRVVVPARDRVEVRLPAAAGAPGTARFQVLAAAAGAADAASFSFPVWTPATTEAFAVYGEIDEAGAAGALAQPVARPPDVVPAFGGLEITTSSTAVAALTDALLYLVDYPYGCAEQIASRVLSVAVLHDVLAAFEAAQLPEPEALQRSMRLDIERLVALQNPDGGFGWWRPGTDSVPYLSVHVALALHTAVEHGHDVPAETLTRCRDYLSSIHKRFPDGYSASARRSIEAFALNVRRRMGDTAASRARDLLRAEPLEDHPLERLGWLLPVLAADASGGGEVAAIVRHLDNRAAETAGAAHFTSRYDEDGWVLLHSERRTDGVLLDALIEARPDHDLVVKLVRGLLGHRTRGHWGNTQENAFILLALKRYFDVFESVEPDFVARAWLGDRFALEAGYHGRDTRRDHLLIPMAVLGADEQDLVLAKDGPGRLYYRLGMRYAPSDLALEAADRGFRVEREYVAVDDPGDVTRDADGTWRLALGATVKVVVTMTAPAPRSHVALVDPLPAGLEALNPALAVTGSLPADEDGAADDASGRGWWGRWWNRPWYDHQNLRDERTEAFAARVGAGVYTYSYFARATTPGRFVVPPPKAEEMYAPETFGRGASGTMIVATPAP